jgi:hypothetical protein
MAFATPRRPDRPATAGQNDRAARDNVPYISEFDPLPCVKTEGRWGEPVHENGKWRQALRYPHKLTTAHRTNGLLPYLVTDTEDELAALRAQQDALLTRLTKYERAAQGVVGDVDQDRAP